MTSVRFIDEHPINFGARLVKPGDVIDVEPAIADRLVSTGRWARVTTPIGEAMADAFSEPPAPVADPWAERTADPEEEP